jgi:hypothetical protein
MTTYITIIDSEGDIEAVWTTGAIPSPAEGTYADDNTKTVVHLPGSIEDLALYRDTHYYKDGAFVVRENKPGSYYNWKDEAWVQDVAALYAAVRQERDNLLTMSDWTQYVDSPLPDQKKFEWAEYRQTLRDIMAILPSDLADPEALQWPTPPS